MGPPECAKKLVCKFAKTLPISKMDSDSEELFKKKKKVPYLEGKGVACLKQKSW